MGKKQELQASNYEELVTTPQSEEDVCFLYGQTKAEMADFKKKVIFSKIEKTDLVKLQNLKTEGAVISLQLNHVQSLLDEDEGTEFLCSPTYRQEMYGKYSALIEKHDSVERELELHLISAQQNKSDPFKLITFIVGVPVGLGTLALHMWGGEPIPPGILSPPQWGAIAGVGIVALSTSGEKILGLFKSVGRKVCAAGRKVGVVIKVPCNALSKAIKENFWVYYAQKQVQELRGNLSKRHNKKPQSNMLGPD